MTTPIDHLAVERAIADAFINQAIAQGYAVAVDNGGDTLYLPPSTDAAAVLAAMFDTDEEKLLVYGQRNGWSQYVGFAWFVHGNSGWEVIADYSCKLDELGLMTDAEQVAAAAEAQQ